MKIHTLLLGLSLILPLTTATSAQSPEWREHLNQQAMTQLQCEIQYLTNVKEDAVAGQPSIAARIHCTDGRSFDASRLGNSRAFDLKACLPQVC